MKSIEAPHLMDPAWIKAEKFAALALKGTAWGIALSVAFTIIAGSGANHPVWRAVDPDGGMWRWSIALGLGAPYAFAFVCGVLALRTHPYRDEDPASVFNACAGVAGFVLYSVLAWLMWP
ncbi:MAG: hypothetical protein M5R36_04080 [Deltaproteobacteria bacterium]|nr:hypothetical protein [Deltaproteobacteria bacterium]